MYIQTIEVSGFKSAIAGMRNPMNSWDKSDSYLSSQGEFFIGKDDLELGKKLVKAGGEHRKFLRMIQVWVNINMPRYFWSEYDTYHFNTKNSCSTMHRLLHPSTSITKDLFVYDKEDEKEIEVIIEKLNTIREDYLVTKDVKLIRRAKQLLPEGFLQLRTVNTNYEEIRNIYNQRKNHRLKEEWVDMFCKWVESLPYYNYFIKTEVSNG